LKKLQHWCVGKNLKDLTAKREIETTAATSASKNTLCRASLETCQSLPASSPLRNPSSSGERRWCFLRLFLFGFSVPRNQLCTNTKTRSEQEW